MATCLSFYKFSPFCKRIYSKRKEFAPTGKKFFSFRADPFAAGDKINLDIFFFFHLPIRSKFDSFRVNVFSWDKISLDRATFLIMYQFPLKDR